MGFGTKLRLQQVTGSLGAGVTDISTDGKLSATATGSIAAESLADVLGHLAAGIQKIHGAASWSEADLGGIHSDLTFKDDKKLKFGDAGDVTFEYDEDGDDVLQIASAAGHVRIGHGAATQLQFRDADIHIASAENGVLDITADTRIDLNAVTDVTDTTAATSTSSGALTVDGGVGIAGDLFVGDELYLRSDGSQIRMGVNDDLVIEHEGTGASIVATGSLELTSADSNADLLVSAGRDLHLQTDGTSRISVGDSVISSSIATDSTSTSTGALTLAGGLGVAKNIYAGEDLHFADSKGIKLGAGEDVLILHDNSTGLDISVTGSLDLLAAADSTFKATGTGRVILSGSSGPDSVLVQSSLQVEGDLTVNGTTTTLDTTNLLVEDPIVVLNKNNSSANGQGGIAIEAGGSSDDLVFGRVANDTWGVGTKDTSGGTVTTLADMALTKFRASHLELGSANNYLLVTGGDLSVTASANFLVDAAGDIKLDADGGDIEFLDGGTSLLKITNDSTDVVFAPQASDKDLIFKSTSTAEVFRLDSDQNALVVSDGLPLRFRDSGLNINSPADGTLRLQVDGTDTTGSLALVSAGGINLRGGDENDSVYFENSPLQLEQISEPSSTTDKLYNVGGDLFWNGAQLAVGSVNEKGILNVTATIASGTAVEMNGTTSGVTNLFPGGGDNFSITGLASPVRDVQVYVNGQLLLTGSDSQVGLGQADYTFVSTGSIKYGFSLEPGDKIQAIKRANSSTVN